MPQSRESDVQPAKDRARSSKHSPEDYPNDEQRMQDEDGHRKGRIETRGRETCGHSLEFTAAEP